MNDDVVSVGASPLAELLKKRVAIYGEEFLYTSQEPLITFLYAYSLIAQDVEVLDRLFIDYPFNKQGGSRGKFDIYIDVGVGCYIEIKYIRPIPSGMNLPLPRHRGTLINDLIRLAYKTDKRSNKYLLLVASREFITHLINKPGFPIVNDLWHGKLRDLIVAETEKRQIRSENEEFLDKEVILKRLNYKEAHPLHIVLWKTIPKTID